MDIETMKARKNGQVVNTLGNKRYLVVTLTIGGTKFHYPLPLSPT